MSPTLRSCFSCLLSDDTKPNENIRKPNFADSLLPITDLCATVVAQSGIPDTNMGDCAITIEFISNTKRRIVTVNRYRARPHEEMFRGVRRLN